MPDMRFTTYMDQIILPLAMEQSDHGATIVDHFQGAWEVWFQVEIALRSFQNAAMNGYTFQREESYPNHPAAKCDLVVDTNPGGAQILKIWLELKVLLHHDASSLRKRIEDDVKKMSSYKTDLRHAERDVTAGVIAFAPKMGGPVLSEMLGTTQSDEYQYCSWEGATVTKRWLPITDPTVLRPDSDAPVLIRRTIID